MPNEITAEAWEALIKDNHKLRVESLTIARDIGADLDLLKILESAIKVARRETIVLPKNRLEGMSRGKGWARKGQGKTAEWGEREDNGYRVGPGNWIVCGADGFSREKRDAWKVEHVQVGGQTWTIAN